VHLPLLANAADPLYQSLSDPVPEYQHSCILAVPGYVIGIRTSFEERSTETLNNNDFIFDFLSNVFIIYYT
jgi:hypothetical protein